MVRTGSRGLLWLEPLVEVDTGDGARRLRPGRGRRTSTSLVDAGLLDGGAHPLRLGPTDELPGCASQQRVTFARVGVVDPLSLADYRGARRPGRPASGALTMTPPRSSPR